MAKATLATAIGSTIGTEVLAQTSAPLAGTIPLGSAYVGTVVGTPQGTRTIPGAVRPAPDLTFGGHGLYVLKGQARVHPEPARPEVIRWEATEALALTKHTIEHHFKYAEPGEPLL